MACQQSFSQYPRHAGNKKPGNSSMSRCWRNLIDWKTSFPYALYCPDRVCEGLARRRRTIDPHTQIRRAREGHKGIMACRTPRECARQRCAHAGTHSCAQAPASTAPPFNRVRSGAGSVAESAGHAPGGAGARISCGALPKHLLPYPPAPCD